MYLMTICRAIVTRYKLTEESRNEADTDVAVDQNFPAAVMLNPLEVKLQSWQSMFCWPAHYCS